jgi:MoaA/NifB/PqqE/SkfB family radical SAM enzyme
MYLQITTKCNMTCAHCGFSCGKNVKHGELSVIEMGIEFCSKMNDESISIGGGEPTLHPKFFQILKRCMFNFNFVWLATNGSQTEKMYRLHNIMDNFDYENFTCNHPEECEENGYCNCNDFNYGIIENPDGKLSVALSQDYFHSPIDPRIVDLWTKMANRHNGNGYEIRNVTNSNNGIIGQGRAKKNKYNGKGCICSDLIIKPDGKIRLCGCTRSPVIGNVWGGIEEKWEDIIYYDDGYNNSKCCKDIGKKP